MVVSTRRHKNFTSTVVCNIASFSGNMKGHQTVYPGGIARLASRGLAHSADLVSKVFRAHFVIPARGLSLYTNINRCIQSSQGV